MAELGPWPPDRRVAVAYSGGPDSGALLALVCRWAGPAARPLALVVDHGLRAGSAAEAVRAVGRARALGCDVRVLAADGLRDGPALQARARDARHGLLAAAALEAGRLDLVFAHHAEDQAETCAMRREARSGPEGLAGMAAVRELHGLRLVRPLLRTGRARLRATARAASLSWDEDPSNADRRFARARLRAMAGPCSPPDAACAEEAANARREQAEAAARFVAAHVVVREDGVLLIDTGALPPFVLAAALRAVSGRCYPPPTEAVARLAGALRPATLGGARLTRAPARLGGTYLVAREPAAMDRPVVATPGACWDGRFRVAAAGTAAAPPPFGWTVGALGDAASAWRDRSPLPASAVATLPALRDDRGRVRAVFPFAPDGRPALHPASDGGPADNFHVMFSPRNPLLPSFFTNRSHPAVSCDG